MSDLAAHVDAANPHARLIEITTSDVRRLCKWLGTPEENRKFNRLMRYVLAESARFCPEEDHLGHVANVPNWNWRNPFTAFNCTWGMAHPADFPEPGPSEGVPCGPKGGPSLAVVERVSSTTCARAMLCSVDATSDGRDVGDWTRCNLEGYGGVDYDTYGPQIKATLAAMPDGRCPYPPGDVPGGGFSLGHPDYRDPKVVIFDT
uniref:Uncharacterized protein n=1 Tax=Haptolina ericina TaxID=156174 RepID=A0A7S3BTX1_9EUKA